MTLIANYFIGPFPFFHGDSLITAEVDLAESRVPLPYNSHINGKIDGAFITGLYQKLVIVSPSIAFCWTGSLKAAKKFNETLISLSNKLNPLNFKSEMEKLNINSQALGLIIMCFEAGQLCIFDFGVDHVELPEFGEIRLGGSGKGDAYSTLARLSYKYHKDMSGILDFYEAIDLANVIATELFSLNVLGGYGLNNRWGGIIETMFLDCKGFRKPTDTMYIFWELTITKDGSLDVRKDAHYIKQFYINDILLCYYRRSSENRNEVFVVPTLTTDLANMIVWVNKNSEEIQSRCRNHNLTNTFYNIVVLKNMSDDSKSISIFSVNSAKYYNHYNKILNSTGEDITTLFYELIDELLRQMNVHNPKWRRP
ncbi:MAG: hypothetical protein H6912_10595 [Kordiimonadaceae bacterium]|nr:hypothetical protein [Kordiimonadaceae bacterium]